MMVHLSLTRTQAEIEKGPAEKRPENAQPGKYIIIFQKGETSIGYIDY